MIRQGIHPEDIIIAVDKYHMGVLWAMMEVFRAQEVGCWHLQDDVLISRQFKKATEYYPKEFNTIINGFCSAYIQGKPSGLTNVRNIWYSFPCFYTPERYANEVAEWFYKTAIHNPDYKDWVKQGRHVDEFFRIYLREHYPDLQVLNLNPNLIEHVDWLIGGSVTNPDKEGLRRSKYWIEPELVTDLEEKLKQFKGE